MKIKQGDTVQMLSGKDRGKQGKVIQVLPTEGKVVVEGLNTFTKHLRPQGGRRRKTEGEEKGQRIELSRAVDASKVVYVCKKCNKASRVGIQILKDGSKARVCKKCKETIENDGK